MTVCNDTVPGSGRHQFIRAGKYLTLNSWGPSDVLDRLEAVLELASSALQAWLQRV